MYVFLKHFPTQLISFPQLWKVSLITEILLHVQNILREKLIKLLIINFQHFLLARFLSSLQLCKLFLLLIGVIIDGWHWIIIINILEFCLIKNLFWVNLNAWNNFLFLLYFDYFTRLNFWQRWFLLRSLLLFLWRLVLWLAFLLLLFLLLFHHA